MAYKQKPGRGNMPKTGAGIPPTLMSCSPMKQELTEKEKKNATTGNKAPEYVEKEASSYKHMEGNRTTYNKNSTKFNKQPQGTSGYNATTGKYEAKPGSATTEVKTKSGQPVSLTTKTGTTNYTGSSDLSKLKDKERGKIDKYYTTVDSLDTAHGNELKTWKANARLQGKNEATPESEKAFKEWQAAKTKSTLEAKTKAGEIKAPGSMNAYELKRRKQLTGK